MLSASCHCGAVKIRLLALAIFVVASVLGCASGRQAVSPSAPVSREQQSNLCVDSARRAEQIQFSPKAARVTGDNEISLARRADPFAYTRCMRAAGFADPEPAASAPKPE